MRFASLGSGSKGNATLIQEGDTCLLIDSGFSLRELERRLARLGLTADQITAVLVTHEHGDHIGGVGPLARKHGMPVWTTRGTMAGGQLGRLPDWRPIDVHEPLAIGNLAVQAYPVPHDAREPCQFVFGNGDVRLGLLTDAGGITAHIVERLDGVAALILECNHDETLLAEGPYPPALKARVGGRFGHLSNAQAAELLTRIDTGALQHVIAAHLSEQNNTAQHARAALSTALGCHADWIGVADQANGFDWRAL
ncbi:MAG TPA: MBL fold metallo-hydrolase [Gammaproteobacteria bacterium]|nr:MBL fold metallo-hydrolase [Gammaproteobacteria bacterium]